MLEQAIRPQEINEPKKKFTVDEIEEILEKNSDKESFLPEFLGKLKKWEFDSVSRKEFHNTMKSKSDWKNIMNTLGGLDKNELETLTKMSMHDWEGALESKESNSDKITFARPFGTEYGGLTKSGIVTKILQNPEELKKIVQYWQEKK